VDFAFRSPWGDSKSTAESIRCLADRYLAQLGSADRSREERVVNEIGPLVRERQHLTRTEFLEICRWKSKRPSPLYEKNGEEDVRDISHIAFTSSNERLRIGTLILLDGVSWSVAAALLHICHREPYPMFDVRVTRLITGDDGLYYQLKPGEYLPFWVGLTRFTRELAVRSSVEMRTMDRALFQLDIERNGKLPAR
jgi:hypothetical protein